MHKLLKSHNALKLSTTRNIDGYSTTMNKPCCTRNSKYWHSTSWDITSHRSTTNTSFSHREQ
ncbi:hypothetical protein PR048_011199 [Dryococelus australis]|uniref:Uncharacterized protein n=1 Tax=Dryococelus australis TaxID=614101 RepID=A0ABQ9HKY5_9NEOP|nr:hypothetical protein PR048_011199 [Dryococelus australis]